MGRVKAGRVDQSTSAKFGMRRSYEISRRIGFNSGDFAAVAENRVCVSRFRSQRLCQRFDIDDGDSRYENSA